MQVVETTERSGSRVCNSRPVGSCATEPSIPWGLPAGEHPVGTLPTAPDTGSRQREGFTLPGMLPWTLKGSTTRSLEMEVIAPTAVVQREQFPSCSAPSPLAR